MIMASDEPANMQFDFEDPQVGASLHAIGDDQLDDHGLVDMQSDRGLEALVLAMEGTISSMNVSLSHLSTLVNDFVKVFASNGMSGVLGGGPTHVVTPP